MRHIRERLAIASLFFICAIFAGDARAADDDPGSKAREAAPLAGAMLKRNVAVGNFPLDKRYEQMTPEQRERIKAHYEAMAPGDEPPFPAEGMGPIMVALQKGSAAYRVSGQLDVAVEVGPDGSARTLTVYQAPDDAEFRKFVASLLTVTHYKPGVCGGRP